MHTFYIFTASCYLVYDQYVNTETYDGWFVITISHLKRHCIIISRIFLSEVVQ